MGLDLIEIVIETEEEFEVSLSHDDIPLTCGELLDATLHSLRVRHPERFVDDAYPDRVWEQLKGLICTQLGVSSEEVVPSANFVTDLGCV